MPGSRPEGSVVRLGGEVEGIAFDARSGLLAAATREPGRLTLIDGGSLRVVSDSPVGDGARHVGFAGPGGPVLVPAQFADELDLVHIHSGTVRAIEVGESPHDVAVAAGRTFVGDEGGDDITVLHGRKVADTIPAPDQPGAVEEVGGTVAVVSVAERVLTTYDPRSLAEVGRANLGEGPTHAVSLGDRLFVVDTGGDAVLELSVSAQEPEPAEVARVAAPGTPYALAIDARRERLWVTETAVNEVAGFDVSDGIEPIGSFPTVQQPNSVAVDERSGAVFVAGASRGEIQRFVPGG